MWKKCKVLLAFFCIFNMKWELKLYDINTPREIIVEERDAVYLSRIPEQRFFGVLQLNYISVTMNGGKPLKSSQGKGLVIRKPTI